MIRSSGPHAQRAASAAKDNAPRVIQQFTSVFLVSRTGELWRVYDGAVPDGTDRRMPSPGSDLPVRLFVSLARRAEARVLMFTPDDSRAIDAPSLQRQLDASVAMS